MRNAALMILAAAGLLAVAGDGWAKGSRYFVHRSSPAILVVPDPGGYSEPRVYVRRYEGVVFEYVASSRYRVHRSATCSPRHRAVRICKLHQRY